MTTYADLEPLVTSSEMDRIEGACRSLVSIPDDAQFSAWRVPTGWGGEVHLLIQSPHPRKMQREAGAVHTTYARMLAQTWDQYQKQRDQYVDTREDKLLRAFVLMANRHHDELDQLRNTIN